MPPLGLGAASAFGGAGADKVALHVGKPPNTSSIKRPVLVAASAHGSARERNCAFASTICLTMGGVTVTVYGSCQAVLFIK